MGCSESSPRCSPGDDSMVMFPWIEELLPHYSEASVNTRELVHDGSADDQWEWTREGSTLSLVVSLLKSAASLSQGVVLH